MTTERQREAARLNIKEAQQANRSRHGDERSAAQKEAQRKATAAAAERRRSRSSSSSDSSR
jgi:hypothetical protein